jgi:hypothetical protein
VPVPFEKTGTDNTYQKTYLVFLRMLSGYDPELFYLPFSGRLKNPTDQLA